MSVGSTLKKNSLYLVVVAILMLAIYSMTEYHLKSVSKELMQNWVESEHVSIQEGSLYTSITKMQRFLISSSSYVRGVNLVKVDNQKVESRIQFGSKFTISADELNNVGDEIHQKRVGFLHQRTTYKIINQNGVFYLIFDAYSSFLTMIFFVTSGVIILAVVYTIYRLQKLEQIEAQRREELLKLAINDLLINESASQTLESQMPQLIRWWRTKKNELGETKRQASEQQDKALIGDLAAQWVHDIRGSLRNIKESARSSKGLEESYKKIIAESVDKISGLSQEILSETKAINQKEDANRKNINILSLVELTVSQKQTEYANSVKIILDKNSKSDDLSTYVDSQQLGRSIGNLIDNAIEASGESAVVTIIVEDNNEAVSIKVKDQGIGISQTDLKMIGVKGFTRGKSEGNGLGVYFAKRCVEDVGGRFLVESTQGVGSIFEMVFPIVKEEASESSIHRLTLKPNQHLLILEDQKLNQHMIRSTLEDNKVDKSRYTMFSNSKDFEEWLLSNKDQEFIVYSDYYLESPTGEMLENGLSVIKRLSLSSKTVLFTSAYDEPEILNEARALGVPVISKDDFFGAKIRTI